MVPDHQSADLKQLADSYFSVLTQRCSQCRRRRLAYLGRRRAIEPCPPNLWRMATVGSESDASCRLEYREDVFRNNLAQAPSLRTWGFLLDHLTGFPGLPPGWGDVQGWAGRAVTLPEG